MNFSLSSADFAHIMQSSQSLNVRDLSFRYAPSARPGLGFVVPKKYGDAVRRNLFRRRCRSLFTSTIIHNKILCSVVVRPNKQNISLNSINDSFACLYNQLLS